MWQRLELSAKAKGIEINSVTDRKAGKITCLIILHQTAIGRYITALN
jgi:hypothetical protein